jgi:hypothetical protein
MMVFLGGIAAVFLGIIGIIIWWGPFLRLLAGAIPMMLLLGGALAAYLGYDEVKDKLPFGKKEEKDEFAVGKDDTAKYKEEAEKYKKEAERLQAELEKSKSGS